MHGKKSLLFAYLIVVLSVLFSGPALAEDGYSDYRIEPLGMSMSIPEDVRVLTRDMEDTDPNLRGLDMTASHLAYLLSIDDIYLEACRDDEDWLLDVCAYESDDFIAFDSGALDDLSLYSDTFLEQLKGSLEESNPGMSFVRVDIGGCPFFLFGEEEDGYYYHSYFSIVNGYEVWLRFSVTMEELGSVVSLWNDILDRVTFGQEPTDGGEPAEEAAKEDGAEEPAEEPEIPKEETEAPAPTEETILYTLDEDEFTIELPADLLVLTRGMDADDPALAAVGMSPEQVDAQLELGGNCLDAMPGSLTWEFIAATQANDDTAALGDAALLDEGDFALLFTGYADSVAEELAAAIGEGANSVAVTDEGSVLIGGLRYNRVSASYRTKSSLFDRTVQYATAFGGRFYSFSFSGSLPQAEQEAILAGVTLTAEPIGVVKPAAAVLSDWEPILQKVSVGVTVFTAIGAVVGGIVGYRRSKKKKTGSHLAGKERPAPEYDARTSGYNMPGAQTGGYSIPGARQDDENGGTPGQ